MKTNKLYLALLLFNFILFAQIPTGYYNSATGTEFTLKTQLYNIINPHTTLIYGSGLWNLYQTSDVRPNGNVWDIYSNCDFIFGTVANGGNQDDGTLGTLECQRYNKEHTFPKSWFSGAAGMPMYSDAFNVMPSDKKYNGMRGNLAYATVSSTVTTTYGNGFKIGSCAAPNYPYALQVLEPADEFKGDFARNYFYMATCYENLIATWQTLDANGDTVLDGSSDKVFEQWYLEMLYNWHIADPVSQKEINRNNAIYPVQGNRNPFIDHPEWVFTIWGSFLNTNSFDLLDTISVYPNPVSDDRIEIQTNSIIDQIELVNLNGQLIQKINKPQFQDNKYQINNLPKGFYFLKMSDGKQIATKKIVVN